MIKSLDFSVHVIYNLKQERSSGKMIGLKYLRSCLGISAEELGKLLGVSQSLLSRWENGAQNISKKSLESISEVFQCEKLDLQSEVTDTSMIRLSKAAADYARENFDHKVDENLVNEIQNLERQEQIRKTTDTLYNNPELAELIYKVMGLSQNGHMEEMRFLVALEELMAAGRTYNIAVGASNYSRGLIAKDDLLVEMMIFAMEKAFKKKKS